MAYFSHNMKYLIIHPEDPTTTFLKKIYAPIKNKTVITGDIAKSKLRKLIDAHDQVLMLGHGSPMGLLSVNQFMDTGSYIIDESEADSLRKKTNNIFIWCHANFFVNKHGLAGFNSGMFISEVDEANYCGFYGANWNLIEESNKSFVSTVSSNIHQPLPVFYKSVLHEYAVLAKTNPIAKFNLERLFHTEIKRH